MKEKTYIGYVRVSSTDQNEARQLKALEKFRKPMYRIFIDKCSGKIYEYSQHWKFINDMFVEFFKTYYAH
ncbi:MAG: recombinase family protein [Oscillospiraceae bacterium]|nr:recombinase family protein [Oscillospiraceae bacterium]